MNQIVVFRHQFRQIADMIGNTQTLAQRLHQLNPRRTVAVMPGPQLRRRQPLAEIVTQGGEAHVDIRAKAGGDRQRHQSMNAGINFRVPFGRRRNAIQLIDFRKQHRQRAALSEHLEIDLGLSVASAFSVSFRRVPASGRRARRRASFCSSAP